MQRFASWHKREGFTFVRRERREGRNAAVYESTAGIMDVDDVGRSRHRVAVRVEIVRPPEDLHGLQLS